MHLIPDRPIVKASIRLTFGVALALIIPSFAHAGPIEPTILEKEITTRLERVAEFKAIRAIAGELGLRAWIFGGTASAFGHYVRWDIEREHGNTRYGANRFDYHYSNIYRSSQDLDVVIDGTDQQREEFVTRLQKRFPYVQGSKEKWEVRLLQQNAGDKDALLGNRDYLEQHTDSNSTGMIEISKPKGDESAVRDLRHWNSKSSDFLEDLSTGTIHYYFSETHGSTARAIAGKNPEILSAIRYLTKIVQYDLVPAPRDLEIVRGIVARFELGQVKDSYVKNWIEKNAPKLLKNAIDVERAWNLIEEVGLRRKLAVGGGSSAKKDGRTLAWWFNKEPIRSYPIGEGPGPAGAGLEKKYSGKTARELKLTVLAHGTSDFSAFESITLSHQGLPNFFISRDGNAGEAAIYGDGVYFRVGTEGAGHSNFTIRVRIDPNAIEGKDFLLVNKGEYVVAMNRKAFSVIPESLSVDIAEWFRMVARGDQFSEADQGIVQGIRSRVEQDATRLTEVQDREISALLRKAQNNPENFRMVFDEWSRLRLKLAGFQLSPLDEFKLVVAPGTAIDQGISSALISGSGEGPKVLWTKFKAAVEKVKSPEARNLLYVSWLNCPSFGQENSLEEMIRMLFDTHGTPHYLERGFYAKWGDRVNRLLLEPRTAAETERLRALFVAEFPKVKEHTSELFRALEETTFPEKIIPLDTWIELAATNRLPRVGRYGKEPLAEMLGRVDLATNEATRGRAIEIARALQKKNGGALPAYFYELWVNLPVASTESSLSFGAKFTKSQIEPLMTAQAPSALFEAAIARSDPPTFAELMKTWRAYFTDDAYHAGVFVGLREPIIQRVANGSPALVKDFPFGSVIHEMRTGNIDSFAPFFKRWVEVGIEKKNIPMITAAVEAFFYEEIQPLSDEFGRILDFIYADRKARGSLLGKIVEKVPHYSDPRHAGMRSHLKRIMTTALQENDDAVIKAGIMRWFRSAPFHQDAELSRSVIDYFVAKKDWRGFKEYVEYSRGVLTESEFQLVLETSDRYKLKSLFEALAGSWQQDPGLMEKGLLRRRLAALTELAERRKWVGELHHLAGSYFSAYEVKQAMPLASFLDLLDTGFRNSEFKLVHNLIYWHLRERPKAIHQHFALAHRELIRRLFELRNSKDAKARAFGEQIFKEVYANKENLVGKWSSSVPADLRADYADLFKGKNGDAFNRRNPRVLPSVEKLVAQARALEGKSGVGSPKHCQKLLKPNAA